MQMKKILVLLLPVVLLFNAAHAEGKLRIHRGGDVVEHIINEIVKIDFILDESTLLVHKANETTPYIIEQITKIDFDLNVSVEEMEKVGTLLKGFKLLSNFPNPFNPSTTINYKIGETGLVEIKIFDVNGRLTNTLVSENRTPGDYSVEWAGNDSKGNDVAAGMYFYTLSLNGVDESRKMLLVK